MNLLLEIPVCTSEAALKAIEHGVDRLEICSGFEVGGLTPVHGMGENRKIIIYAPVCHDPAAEW